MLIVFPLGLLATSFFFDLIALFTHNSELETAAFWMIIAGIVGGLVAAVFGLIDWLGIPSGTRAKAIGLGHGLSNVLMVALFAASWLLRSGAPGDPGVLPIVLSFVGVGLVSLGGFLGGELVFRMGVGVEEGANVNASGSSSGRTSGGGSGNAREVGP
jgi:uncharacterized membrane protein